MRTPLTRSEFKAGLDEAFELAVQIEADLGQSAASSGSHTHTWSRIKNGTDLPLVDLLLGVLQEERIWSETASHRTADVDMYACIVAIRLCIRIVRNAGLDPSSLNSREAHAAFLSFVRSPQNEEAAIRRFLEEHFGTDVPVWNPVRATIATGGSAPARQVRTTVHGVATQLRDIGLEVETPVRHDHRVRGSDDCPLMGPTDLLVNIHLGTGSVRAAQQMQRCWSQVGQVLVLYEEGSKLSCLYSEKRYGRIEARSFRSARHAASLVARYGHSHLDELQRRAAARVRREHRFADGFDELRCQVSELLESGWPSDALVPGVVAQNATSSITEFQASSVGLIEDLRHIVEPRAIERHDAVENVLRQSFDSEQLFEFEQIAIASAATQNERSQMLQLATQRLVRRPKSVVGARLPTFLTPDDWLTVIREVRGRRSDVR